MGKFYFTITALSFLICSQYLSGQEKQNVIISGTILNEENGQPLGYVQLVSYNTLLSYTTNSNGRFRISLAIDDSIKIVSMGFEAKTLKASDFLTKTVSDSILLSSASYMLNEVIIRAEEKEIHLNLPGNFGVNVDPDAEPDKSIPPPSVEMIFTPLTLAHSVFSKEAKRQRKFQEFRKQQQQTAIWEEIILSGMLKNWIEVEDTDLEEFIIFCNQNIKTSTKDNLLTLHTKVLSLWKEYKKNK